MIQSEMSQTVVNFESIYSVIFKMFKNNLK